jgi:glycosyltransferase 2 family protein
MRIAISVGLLAILIVSLDWMTVLGHLKRLSPAIAAFVIVAWAVQLAVSAWKWQWALRVHDLRFPYLYLSRVLVIGFFLNNFLPTSIGGDAYRIFRTVPSTPPKSRAISAVVLERLVGLASLLLLGLVGALVLFPSFRLARAYVLFAVIGATLCVIVLALIRTHSPRWSESALLRSKWIAPAVENFRTIARAHSAWMPLVALSLLFQIQAIVILWSLFYAFDTSVGLPHAALIAASAGIAAVIPLSINGLGIVEATIAGTAVAVGVSYEAGLLVALLMRILLIPLTLLAALFYAFEPAQVREATSLSG